MNETCACGRPLHYTDPAVEKMITTMVAESGALIPVATPAGKWLVPRHYIALHGIKADELPALAKKYHFEKVGE